MTHSVEFGSSPLFNAEGPTPEPEDSGAFSSYSAPRQNVMCLVVVVVDVVVVVVVVVVIVVVEVAKCLLTYPVC